MQKKVEHRSGRWIIFLNQGATKVELVTYRTIADYSTTELYTLVSAHLDQLMDKASSQTICRSAHLDQFICNKAKARSSRQLDFLNQGTTGVKPMTYGTAADCSTTKLYTHVTLLYPFMYKNFDLSIMSFQTPLSIHVQEG